MTEYAERLNNFSEDKLIDVVKNYRQYGYSEALRATAISILNERGITKEQLQLIGQFENKTYDDAEALYTAFSRNSKIAFILYGLLVVLFILETIIITNSETLVLFVTGLNWIVLISYFIFLIRSFISQNRFYKTINKDYGMEGILLYIFAGMPLYIIMYFYFRNQMKEKIKQIQ